ncbi:MAG: hypothetical protein HOL92_01630 [Opitutales bacterium]|nr:hypothetical protein [Opitutales bacterium]
MRNSTFLITTAALAFNSLVTAEEPCDTIQSMGIIYDSKDSAVEQVKLFGMAQYQIGHVDGTDSAGKSFSDTHEEFRRVWLGGDVKFANGLLFKTVLSVTQGENAATGDQDFEFQHFRNLYLSYDLAKANPNFSGYDRFEIGYGRRSLKLADEWQRSAYLFNPVERSPFSNKLWPTDEGGSHPAGAWIRVAQGKDDVQIGLFSTSHDDTFPGWDDGTVVYSEWTHDLTDGSGLDLMEVVFSGYTQSADATEDKLARGNEWGSSAILRLHNGPWEFHSTIGGGKNSEFNNANRDGSFWGMTFMPMKWLVEDQVKFVSRYQYQHASSVEGIRLNSRYARSAGARGKADMSLSGGRGDRHHNFYMGINYYFCGDNMKIVSGIDYDDIETHNGINVFKGWTASSAFRFYF